MKWLFILFALPCFAQGDSTIVIPPTLEARMIEAESVITKAKADVEKAQKEINDGIKILFEIVGKKPEDYEITGYAQGMLKIKRKKK